MARLSVEIDDQVLARLQAKAQRESVSLDFLTEKSLETYLATGSDQPANQDENSFDEIVKYVVAKNRELYKRLA